MRVGVFMSEGRLTGGFQILDDEKREVLHIKVGSHNDMLLFQIIDKKKGLEALDKLIGSPLLPPHLRLPLIDVEEIERKAQNLVVYDRQPGDDRIGYVDIIVCDHWTGQPYRISVRAFERPKEEEK